MARLGVVMSGTSHEWTKAVPVGFATVERTASLNGALFLFPRRFHCRGTVVLSLDLAQKKTLRESVRQEATARFPPGSSSSKTLSGTLAQAEHVLWTIDILISNDIYYDELHLATCYLPKQRPEIWTKHSQYSHFLFT